MDTQKRKRDEYESDLITYMRMGNISILDALAVKLPDVFTAEILTKLDIEDTLNLAQVNKTYNAAVWTVDGVRSLVTKMRPIKGMHRMKNHVMTYESGPILDPMYHAAENGNLPAARALLESGVDVDKTYDYDEDEDTTATSLAAIEGYAAMVKLLIEKGADLNFNDVNLGATALLEAARLGHSLCAMELIKAGADLDITDIFGRTPLMIAAGAPRGHDIIVGLLINSGADVHRVDDDGKTALTLAEAAAARDLLDIPYDPESRRYTIMGMLKGIDRYPPDRYGD